MRRCSGASAGGPIGASDSPAPRQRCSLNRPRSISSSAPTRWNGARPSFTHPFQSVSRRSETPRTPRRSRPWPTTSGRQPRGSTSTDETPAKTVAHPLEGRDRLELLRAGLAEAEQLYDTYADAVDHAGTEPVLLAAQEGAGRAVRHLGLIAARLYAPMT